MLRQLLLTLNPFSHVFYDSKIKPYSRSLFSDFPTMLEDTRKAVAGTLCLRRIGRGRFSFGFHGLDMRTTRLGLFDYMTLGSFRLIHALDTLLTKIMYAKVNEEYSGPRKAGIYLAKILLAIPFAIIRAVDVAANFIVRGFVSYVSTAALFVLTAIAALITKGVLAWKENKVAKKLTVELEKHDQTQAPNVDKSNQFTHVTLHKALKDYKASVSEMHISEVSDSVENEDNVTTVKVISPFNASLKFKMDTKEDKAKYYDFIEVSQSARLQDNNLDSECRLARP